MQVSRSTAGAALTQQCSASQVQCGPGSHLFVFFHKDQRTTLTGTVGHMVSINRVYSAWCIGGAAFEGCRAMCPRVSDLTTPSTGGLGPGDSQKKAKQHTDRYAPLTCTAADVEGCGSTVCISRVPLLGLRVLGVMGMSRTLWSVLESSKRRSESVRNAS
jgi:hypothetical protein